MKNEEATSSWQVENKNNKILSAKLAEAHTKCHDVLGLDSLCMEYVIHSIPAPPPEERREWELRSFTLLLL